ncbi:MAG: hypothetical protein ACJ75Q_14245 [Gaiellaceae bacterium]
MKRALVLGSVVAGLAVLAGSALGAGPSPGVTFGSPGVVSHDGKLRYLAMRAGGGTLVEAVTTRGGVVRRSRFLQGAFGIPLVAYDGSAAGLTRNGRRLVLYQPASRGATTRFVVLDPQTLRLRRRIALNGNFGFDAMSPDGSLMYLIQLKGGVNGGLDYDVRALDVNAGRLLPGTIVDRREPEEKMTGIPMTRVGSADATWAYTLYAKPSSGAFVHALHTTAREAFCIDLSLHLADGQLGKVRMRVGKNVLMLRLRGKTIAKIDTQSFRVTR